MGTGETAAAFGIGFVAPAVILYGLGFAVAGPAGGSAAAWIQSKHFSNFKFLINNFKALYMALQFQLVHCLHHFRQWEW